MKFFEEPIVEVICMTVQDIVTTSGGEDDNGGGGPAMLPPCMGG